VNAIREIVHFLEINELSFRSNYDKYVHEQGLFNKFFTNTVRRDPSLSQIVSEIPHKTNLRYVVQSNVIALMAKTVSEQGLYKI